MKHDVQYAKLSELKLQDKVQVDDGFSCIPSGAIRTVEKSHVGLWIGCDKGQHYLSGQLNGSGYCVGIYKLESSK